MRPWVSRVGLQWVGLALLAALPLTGMGNYPLHLAIMCLLWGFVSYIPHFTRRI